MGGSNPENLGGLSMPISKLEIRRHPVSLQHIATSDGPPARENWPPINQSCPIDWSSQSTLLKSRDLQAGGPSDVARYCMLKSFLNKLSVKST